MNLKTATLIALIVAAVYTLFEMLTFFMPFLIYNLRHGPIGQLLEIAFPASIALFFFALYSKQNNA